MNQFLPTGKVAMYAGLGLMLLAGCGRPSDDVEVTGVIKWKGRPISKGMIVLEPQAPNQAPAGGKIEDGTFRLRTKPGKMRVQIEAVRETSQRDPETGTMLGEMYIPARYNRKTELEADVTREGENHFEFDLTN